MKKVKSYNDYIFEEDFLGAYDRFINTTARWKNYWWSAVETIFNQSKFWVKHYIIDPIAKIIKRISRGRLPQIEKDRLIYRVEAEGCGAYIVEHFDKNGNRLWIKCGKADNAKKRLKQHFDKDYKDLAETGTVLAWFSCKNSNHALSMENIVRDHFEKQGFEILGNDRFPTLTKITDKDLFELNQKAEILEKLF